MCHSIHRHYANTCDNGFPYSACPFRIKNGPVSSTPGGLGLYVFKEVSAPSASQVTTLLLIGGKPPVPILHERLGFQLNYPATTVVVRAESLHSIIERCNLEAPSNSPVAARLDGLRCCTTIQAAHAERRTSLIYWTFALFAWWSGFGRATAHFLLGI